MNFDQFNAKIYLLAAGLLADCIKAKSPDLRGLPIICTRSRSNAYSYFNWFLEVMESTFFSIYGHLFFLSSFYATYDLRVDVKAFRDLYD
jgi:hypothetical protein